MNVRIFGFAPKREQNVYYESLLHGKCPKIDHVQYAATKGEQYKT